mmetsp:Transcript_123436/g.214081  ORF Transcript_123436/g.214081 Transcript_123436/m.214081 type:complete len:253 (-) Transcript_123436:15-773(-)
MASDAKNEVAPPFFERQNGLSRFCGLHCVNNVLQRHAYGAVDFHQIAIELQEQQAEIQKGCCNSQGCFRMCRAGMSDYTVQVLDVALQREGASLDWFDKRKPLENLRLDDGALMGLVLNMMQRRRYGLGGDSHGDRHWLCVRKLGPGLFAKLDSGAHSHRIFNGEQEVFKWLREVGLKHEKSLVFRVTCPDKVGEVATVPTSQQELTQLDGESHPSQQGKEEESTKPPSSLPSSETFQTADERGYPESLTSL